MLPEHAEIEGFVEATNESEDPVFILNQVQIQPYRGEEGAWFNLQLEAEEMRAVRAADSGVPRLLERLLRFAEASGTHRGKKLCR